MMRNLRYAVLSLILILVLFYNIERIDIDTQNVINIQSYVYILVTAVIVSAFIFPAVFKVGIVRGLFFWFMIYAIVKVVFYYDALPIIGSGNIYLAVIEVSFIIMAWLISFRLAENINELESTIDNFAFLGVDQKISVLQNSGELIKSEVYRSRRYNMPLSLLYFDIDQESIPNKMNKTLAEIQQRITSHYSIVYVAKKLSRHLRRSDTLLVDLDSQRLFLLSFGTPSAGIKALGEKLEKVSEDEFGVCIQSGTATFPEEARTFENLLNLASYDFGGKKAER